jgi:hypothetical protein
MPKGSVWRVWIAQFAHTVFFAGAVVLVLGLPVFPVLITVGNGMIGGVALVHAPATPHYPFVRL